MTWQRDIRHIRKHLEALMQHGYAADPGCWLACNDLEMNLESLELALLRKHRSRKEKKMKLLASKETTIAGLFTGIALIAGELAKFFDSDPVTNMEITTVVAAVGMIIAFWRARDNNKSSETVGIK